MAAFVDTLSSLESQEVMISNPLSVGPWEENRTKAEWAVKEVSEGRNDAHALSEPDSPEKCTVGHETT